MIDGLKLTMTGDELRARLLERVERHRDLVTYYEREPKRKPDPNDKYDYALSKDTCECEQERHAWRAEVLEYIRDHIEADEVYRLGAVDVACGEILPETPPAVEQEEYDLALAKQQEVSHAP